MTMKTALAAMSLKLYSNESEPVYDMALFFG